MPHVRCVAVPSFTYARNANTVCTLHTNTLIYADVRSVISSVVFSDESPSSLSLSMFTFILECCNKYAFTEYHIYIYTYSRHVIYIYIYIYHSISVSLLVSVCALLRVTRIWEWYVCVYVRLILLYLLYGLYACGCVTVTAHNNITLQPHLCHICTVHTKL